MLSQIGSLFRGKTPPKTWVYAIQRSMLREVCAFPPSDKWTQQAAQFGQNQKYFIERPGGKICCIRISNPKQIGPKRNVAILAHPLSRKGKYYFNEGVRIQCYLDLGYDIVLFDFNPFGETGHIDFDYWQDAKAVIDSVKQDPTLGKLVIHGLSFGSFHILRSLDYLPPNSRIVLENTSRYFIDYWKRWIVSGNVMRFFLSLKLDSLQEPIHFVENLTRKDLQVLMIGCEKDKITPVSEMRELYHKFQIPKSFEIFQGKHFDAVKDRARFLEVIRNLCESPDNE